jgi:methylmalonyl-CoA/ethylmalonyl-CoA epimerase
MTRPVNAARGEPRDLARAYPGRAFDAGLAIAVETRQRWTAMTPPAPDAAVCFDHVAIGVPHVAAVSPFLVGELGGHPCGSGPGVGFRWWQWEFARGGRLEILEPDGPPGGFMHRFLEKHGPGLHHVTFKVPVIEEATRRAESLGYEIVGFDDSWPSWKEAFLHPKQALGIVVQLAESHPELEPDDIGEWPFPEEPAERAEPAELLGLRLTASSAEDARRLWQETLLGSCTENAGELVFHWPASPLRIVASVEPAAPQGPRGIEVAAHPGLALPEGPHPVLGTAFLAAP